MYVRLSRQKEGSISLEKQIDKCSRRVQEYEVQFDPQNDVFQDEGSAYSQKNRRRSAFDRLTEAIKEGTYSVLIVYELSRISRRTRETLEFLDLLKDQGVRLVIMKESIDTYANTGTLLVTILAAVAEAESETIAFRVSTTQDSYAAKGRWRGGTVPVGYESHLVSKTAGYVLRPREEEAAMLRKASAMLREGKSLSQTAAALDEEGFRNRKGGGLRASNLGKWLRNPATRGVAIWQGEPALDEDGLPVSWYTEAILTPEEHQEVLDILGLNERAGSSTSNPNILLASLVRCASCGSTMTGVPPTERGALRPHNGHYSCRNVEGSTRCPDPARISMLALDGFVTTAVMTHLTQVQAAQPSPRELEVRRRLNELDVAIDRVRRDLESDLFDGAERTRRDQVKRSEGFLAEQEALLGEMDALRASERRVEQAAITADDWRDMSIPERRTLLRRVTDRVEVGPLDVPRGPVSMPRWRTAIYVYDVSGVSCLYKPPGWKEREDAASA